MPNREEKDSNKNVYLKKKSTNKGSPPLDKVNEYEQKGRSFKINGHYYNFRRENKSKNKYYKCDKKCGSIKSRGSITISPNRQIIKKVEHTCQCQDLQECEDLQEYEETGRRFKINGYNYRLDYESTEKKKYYRCIKRCNAIKCRGSIIISPIRQIVKSVDHTCQIKAKKLEKVQEFEQTDRRFKINGYFYNFRLESKTGNKYYKCDKICNAIRCRGSIKISANREIVKKVEHTCI